jgi:hypothetical protein
MSHKTIDDSTIIDFIKTLENSKIVMKGSHTNQTLIKTITDIVSMDEKNYNEYISKNPNEKVKMIRTEFNDWIQTYSLNETENKIKGGKADNLTPKDIADKFDVSTKMVKDQIKKGKKIESEHTSDEEKQTEIASDHVSEFPDYYDRIEKMEKEADKYWKDKVKENKIFIKNLLRETLTKKEV